MKSDLISVIRDMAKFLGKHLTQLKILQLDDILYIDNFRQLYITDVPNKNQDGKPKSLLVRKGQVGEWKKYMTGENLQKWNQWISKHSKDIGFEIKY